MNTTVEFLDAVKAKTGVTSDYALFPILGVTKQQISRYRNNKDYLGEETAVRVAHILELKPAVVLAAVQAERAKTDEGKAAWKFVYEKLGGIAAGLLICTTLLSPELPASPTAPTDSQLNNNIHYAK